MKRKKLRLHPMLVVCLLLLVAIRIMLPFFLLRQLNAKLGALEGPFCAHVTDLDLRLITGTYWLQGVELFTREKPGAKCEKKVMTVEEAKLSLAWTQLLKGKARLRVILQAPEVLIDPLIEAFQAQPAGQATENLGKGAKETWDALIPWRLDALRIHSGRALFLLFGQGGISAPIEQVEAEATGIESNRETAQPVLFRVKGNVFDSSALVAAGSFTLGEAAARWDVDFSAEQVDLTKANPFLFNRVPMTFTTGRVELFGEAAGKGEGADGYVKLIFSNLDVVSSREKWKSFKQAIVEVVSSLFFIVVKNPKVDTVATELVFKKSGAAFDIDWGGALARSVSHSGGKRVQPGVENRLELPKP